ncbi:hypothetical protein LWI28_018637 [Acer negundo]|uniref:Cationic amino acid transporter C-terminal domain-containing protein n=1 Tax=Acer negundo TaxID=4023 RepID=A0AAD5JKE2_ACENE|nr:hypothetical protein LWI28_018637 [Acer negundo]
MNLEFPYSEIESPSPNPRMDVRSKKEEEESSSNGGRRRKYWRCTKNDFFPETSFENITTYKSALSQTFPRLKNRLLARSSDANELVVLQKESERPMQNASLEFAVEIPVAGGSFSYLRVELGDFIAYIAAGNILLEAIVGAAGLGRSWSSYLASMINTANPDLLRFRVDSLAEGFNLLDPVAFLILLVANGIAMSGTKRTSWLNWIASIVTALVIVFIIVVGFIHAKSSNLVPFFPMGVQGSFKAAAVVYWSYTGFDMVATMAEETKQPSRDIPIGLIGSMSMITVIYCLMALALTMMVNYTKIDVNAAYSVAFAQIGMNWAKYLVSVCALKGMTTSLLVGSLGQARYTTQIARAHMIPPWFALVHPKTETPINATLLVAILSAIIAFFSSLDVLSSVFSFSTLLIFMLVAVALLVRRYYVKDVTPKSHLVKFLVCLFIIIASSIAISAIWNSNGRGWIGYAIAGIMLFSGTVGMAMLPQQHVPKIWGVPLVPWLPSLSIGINLFLVGSLGYLAFLRFIICSAAMLVYYFFVGLHATYDVAHLNQEESNNLESS